MPAVLEQRCIDTNAQEGVALRHHSRILEENLPFDLVDTRQRIIGPYGKGDIFIAKHLVVQMWPVSASVDGPYDQIVFAALQACE
jgi:hypothetical protein